MSGTHALGRYGVLWAALALILYLPVLEFGYFADDEIYLAFSNQTLRELTAGNLIQLLRAPANPWEYLPVRDFSYWLDLQLFGDDGLGLHLTNIVLYGLSGLAVAWLIEEVLAADTTKRAYDGSVMVAATCGAALFLLHPVHVEAVAWIAGRKDVLSGLFSLAFLAALLRYSRSGVLRYLVLSGSLFVAACFSKSAAVVTVIPALLILLRRFSRGGIDRPMAALFVGLLLVLVALAALQVHLHFGASLGIRVENEPGSFASLERASRIVASLLLLLIFPADLGLFHDVYLLGAWHWCVTFACLMAVLGAVVFLCSGRAFAVPLAVVMVFVPLLPYLQIVPFSTWSMASERFLFISVAGVALVWGILCRHIVSSRFALGVSVAVFAALAATTWNRIADWRSTATLVTHEYIRQPSHYLPAMHYVMFIMRQKNPEGIPEVLSRVDRDDAREMLAMLMSLFEAETRHRSDAGAAGSMPADYCRLAERLYLLQGQGMIRLRTEPDMTFSNFLRSLDRHMYYALGNPRRLCRLSV